MKQLVTSAATQYANMTCSEMSWRELISVAIEKAASENLDLVDGASLHDDVVELSRSVDRLVGCNAKRLAKWSKGGTWADDDSRSAPCRLARETGSSPQEAKRHVRRANALQDMPITSAALVSGELSLSRVDLLVNANNSRVADQFRRDEAVLVDQIKHLRFNDAAKVVRYWSSHADAEAFRDKAERQVEQRSAHASVTLEGTLDLQALFDPISGEIFNNELKRIYDELFKADWAEAKKALGDEALVTVETLKRTPAQRRCDALVEMAKRSSTVGPPYKESLPLISVVVGKESFDRVCELASGTVLSPHQVVPHLTKCQLERIVFDGDNRILEIGSKRFFAGALRRAIQVRDGYCQHDSQCEVPAGECDIDHTVPWALGGKTDQDNGKCMCPAHNRKKRADPP